MKRLWAVLLVLVLMVGSGAGAAPIFAPVETAVPMEEKAPDGESSGSIVYQIGAESSITIMLVDDGKSALATVSIGADEKRDAVNYMTAMSAIFTTLGIENYGIFAHTPSSMGSLVHESGKMVSSNWPADGGLLNQARTETLALEILDFLIQMTDESDESDDHP